MINQKYLYIFFLALALSLSFFSTSKAKEFFIDQIEIKEKLPNQLYKIWNETNDFIILVSQKERDNSSMISTYYMDKKTQKWVHQDFGWFSLDYDVNHCVTHGKFTYLEN